MPKTKVLHIRVTPRVHAGVCRLAKQDNRKKGTWCSLLIERVVAENLRWSK